MAICREYRAASHDFQQPCPQYYVLAQRPTLCRRYTKHPPFPSTPSPVPSCARKLLGKAPPAQGVSMRSHLLAARTCAQDSVLPGVRAAANKHNMSTASWVTEALMRPRRQGSEWSAEDWTGLASQVESQV